MLKLEYSPHVHVSTCEAWRIFKSQNVNECWTSGIKVLCNELYIVLM